MEPIAWKAVRIKGAYKDIREAVVDEGRWYLYDRPHDVALGSLTLPTTRAMLDAYDKWPKDEDHAYLDDPAFRKVWAHVAPQSDIIYCSRMEMLIRLIERLRDPRPAAGSLIQVLKAADFKRSKTTGSLYQLDIGKGAVWAWVREEGLRVQFHGRNVSWWCNLMKIQTSFRTISGDARTTFWPESYGDVEAKAAEFLVEHYIPWVRATRITRNTR